MHSFTLTVFCYSKCRVCFNPTGVLRFNFRADKCDIPEVGDQNPTFVLEHSDGITVTLLTMDQVQIDPYSLSAFCEGR